MSRAGVSLGGVLASRARLRFPRQRQNITETLNDVLAYNLLNDVVASKNYAVRQHVAGYAVEGNSMTHSCRAHEQWKGLATETVAVPILHNSDIENDHVLYTDYSCEVAVR